MLFIKINKKLLFYAVLPVRNGAVPALFYMHFKPIRTKSKLFLKKLNLHKSGVFIIQRLKNEDTAEKYLLNFRFELT